MIQKTVIVTFLETTTPLISFRMTKFTFPLPSSASTAIILNGERDAAIKQRLDNYQRLIVTDGAWQDAKQLLTQLDNTHKTPDATVLGDGDSISDPPAYFIHTPSQQYTDFEKALQHISPHEQNADVFWAGGGEMDHFLGNLAVAKQYADHIRLHFHSVPQSYVLLTEAHDSHTVLQGVEGRTLSLFPFPSACVTATGLAYPLQQLKLNQHQQQSLRNHAISDTVTLTVQGSVWLFVSKVKKKISHATRNLCTSGRLREK